LGFVARDVLEFFLDGTGDGVRASRGWGVALAFAWVYELGHGRSFLATRMRGEARRVGWSKAGKILMGREK
jgi:hypothetical protein